MVSQETGTLFIRNVSPETDEGTYHCTLENIAGEVNSTTAQLTVGDTFSKSECGYVVLRNRVVI